MDENPCKIHQESGESKSREVSYSSEGFSSLLRVISKKNMSRIKVGQLSIKSIRNKFDLLLPAVVRNLTLIALFLKLNLRSMVLLLHTELIETVMGKVYYYI